MGKVIKELDDVKHCSVTTDGWTSVAGDKFTAYTIHYINWSAQEPVLKSKILECSPFEAETADAAAIEQDLSRVAEKYDIKEKLVLTVADNASDVQKALELFGIEKIGCAAHKLNLVAKNLLERPEVAALVKKLAKIVRKTKVSAKSKKILSRCAKQLGIQVKTLVSFVKTRWNSVYLMADRALEMRQALVLFFDEINIDSDEKLNDEDWKLLGTLKTVLRPLYLVTLELSSEKMTTLSKVLPVYSILHGAYSADVPNKEEKEYRKVLLDGLKHHFKDLDTQEVYTNSMIFDPRYKSHAFSSKSKALLAEKEAKADALKTAVANESSTEDINDKSDENDDEEEEKSPMQNEFDDLWSSFDQKTANPPGKKSRVSDYRKECIDLEMKKYLSLPKLDRKLCPIKYWKEEGSKKFPYLFQAAQKYLSMPATSVPSERVFSNAGNILNKQRSTLDKNIANMLITLHTNLKTD